MSLHFKGNRCARRPDIDAALKIPANQIFRGSMLLHKKQVKLLNGSGLPESEVTEDEEHYDYNSNDVENIVHHSSFLVTRNNAWMATSVPSTTVANRNSGDAAITTACQRRSNHLRKLAIADYFRAPKRP